MYNNSFSIQISVLVLIAINILAYILPFIYNFGNRGLPSDIAFKAMFWRDNNQVKKGEFYRLITSCFVHGDFLHLLLNMVSLFYLGTDVLSIMVGILSTAGAAPQLANIVFLAVYLGSAFIASYLCYKQNITTSLGASGAIFGLFGFLFIFGVVTQQWAIVINGIINILIMVAIGSQVKGINNHAHFYGFITGLGFGAITIAYVLFRGKLGL